MQDDAQELLETIITKIVDNKDAVKVTKSIDEMGALYTVDIDQRDAGMVIGRSGATINAIRDVIRTVAGKNKSAAAIKLNVPDAPRRERPAGAQGYRFQKPRKRSFDEVENQF
jgi:hypothetical protein